MATITITGNEALYAIQAVASLAVSAAGGADSPVTAAKAGFLVGFINRVLGDVHADKLGSPDYYLAGYAEGWALAGKPEFQSEVYSFELPTVAADV